MGKNWANNMAMAFFIASAVAIITGWVVYG